jgi:TIR domain
VTALAPDIRIYIDRAQLDAASAWQREIFEALDASRTIVCLYSPDYLTSKVCQEEYHIAYLRNREDPGVLLPAYLRTTRLPSFMKLVQYHDVRECDSGRLDDLAHRLVGKIRQGVPRASTTRAASNDASPTGISVSADDSPEMRKFLNLLSDGKEIRLDVRVRVVNDEV